MSRMEPRPPVDVTDTDHAVTVSKLRAELQDLEAEPESTAVTDIVDEVVASLFSSNSFTFQETHVKSSLDELLLSLVALRSSDTHGKQLLDDLASEFDTVLSPGTVYPRLHDLCDDEILEQRELVKTKEYTLEDAETARAAVVNAARQHLALGMVFQATLEEAAFE